MRLIIGSIGGFIVFAAVFFITGQFLLPVVPPALSANIQLQATTTNNLLGVALGLVAAMISFNVALRATRQKK